MGKEVKIGFSIILVLLIVFGVVLAKRLSGPADRAEADPSKTKEASKPEDGAADPESEAKDSAAGSTKTTVVAAKPASSKTAERSPAPAGRWNVVADSERAKDSPSLQTPEASPPSLMPNPPMPVLAEPYNRYGDTHQAAQAADTWQDTAVETSDTSAAGQAYDPFQGRTRPAASQPARQYTVSTGGSGSTAKFATNTLRREDGKYEVQPNDSYWTISQKLYGSGSYFKALAEHNRDKVPREDRLEVGEVIFAPGVEELEKAYPGLCPKPSRRETVRKRASAVSTRSRYAGGRTYVVQEGDTLFDIARYELGKASRWIEIHQLNRAVLGDDFDYLTPGIELALPGDVPIHDGPADSVTRRPGTDSVHQR